jgi:hypothetical protein
VESAVGTRDTDFLRAATVLNRVVRDLRAATKAGHTTGTRPRTYAVERETATPTRFADLQGFSRG